jgi:hypothetical protein
MRGTVSTFDNSLRVKTPPYVQPWCSSPIMFNGSADCLVTLSLSLVGLGTEFRSEKIPRNRLGTVSDIPRKKVLIPRYSEFRGRANSEAWNGTERNSAKKRSFTEQTKY